MISFSLVSAVILSTDFGIYFLLRQVLPASGAKTISFICGGVVAYLLNTFWVFEQGQASASSGVKFAIANTLLLGVNVLTNGSMLRVWPAAVAVALGMATCVTSALSFVCFKWWVYRS